MSPECVCEVSAQNIPTDHLLYNFEKAYFECKQKRAVFVHVSLNSNELLLPAPICFGSDYDVYRAEIMHFKQ